MRKAVSTREPAKEMSKHLEFASASHRGGAAASLLDQLELHGGSVAKAIHFNHSGAKPGFRV